MKSAALELGQYNITVNALLPGLVDTALTRYDKRLVESMGETGHKPQGPQPTAQDLHSAHRLTHFLVISAGRGGSAATSAS